MEGVLEPTAVVALLSLVAAFRWRMYSLGASSVRFPIFYLCQKPDKTSRYHETHSRTPKQRSPHLRHFKYATLHDT